MKARTAFDLVMTCATARRAPPDCVTEKNLALEKVIEALAGEIRRILTPEEEQPEEKLP
jgi:hypothetical protein